jgi:hypothetical protein
MQMRVGSGGHAPIAAPVLSRARRTVSPYVVRSTTDLSGLGLHIDPSELTIRKLIGQGSFGEVFEVRVASGFSEFKR